MPNASNPIVRATAHPDAPRRGAGAVHLVIMTLYAAAGLGAAVSLYGRMLDLLEDPMPAAILTLTAALLVLVFTSGGDRRA